MNASESGVHTDPHALEELSEVASHEHAEVGPDGAVAGYSAGRTLRLGVELRRQLKRRRTQLLLGFVAILPFILVIAFELGQASPNRRSGGFVDLATASAPNFVVLALFVSGTFLLPVMSLIVGLIWYGAGDAISPTGDSVSFGQAIVAIGLSTVYIILQLAWVAGLALALSVSTDAPLGAVGGAVLVAILSQILDQITALEGLRNYLPTHYAFSWMDLISTDIDWSNLASGMLSASIYGTVFFLIAGRRFATKDITS